jgi:DmpG-like communication domain
MPAAKPPIRFSAKTASTPGASPAGWHDAASGLTRCALISSSHRTPAPTCCWAQSQPAGRSGWYRPLVCEIILDHEGRGGTPDRNQQRDLGFGPGRVSQLQGRCGGRGTGEAAHIELGAGEQSRDLRVVTARYSRVVPTVTGNVRGSDHAPRCIRRCHSGFLRHAESSAQEYGLDVRGILIEVGRRGLVGGQEDMIGDVALDLLAARNPKNLPFGGRAADPFGATVGAALKTVP